MDKPIISAGRDTIIHQQFVILHGTAQGNGSANNYYWDLIKLPASQGDYPALKNRNTLSPALMGLQKGLYGVRLTATNQFGSASTDTVWIAVDTAISFSGTMKIHLLPQLQMANKLSSILESDSFCSGESIVSKNDLVFRNPNNPRF